MTLKTLTEVKKILNMNSSGGKLMTILADRAGVPYQKRNVNGRLHRVFTDSDIERLKIERAKQFAKSIPKKKPTNTYFNGVIDRASSDGSIVLHLYAKGAADLLRLKKNGEAWDVEFIEVKQLNDSLRFDQYAFKEKMRILGIPCRVAWEENND